MDLIDGGLPEEQKQALISIIRQEWAHPYEHAASDSNILITLNTYSHVLPSLPLIDRHLRILLLDA